MQAAVVPASAQAVRGRSKTDNIIRDLGPDEVVRDGKSLAAAGGADVILSTSNSTKSMVDRIQGLRPDGRVVTMGADVPLSVSLMDLIVNETFDASGRLIQLLGTNVPSNNRGHGFGRAYMDSATETPANGDIEVWQIANLTGDTHPIHFHLVNVQIISRQPFKVSTLCRMLGHPK
jgi:FtsP/CotA-like multicopper oxidase with cupredoxin domain